MKKNIILMDGYVKRNELAHNNANTLHRYQQTKYWNLTSVTKVFC